MKTQLTFSLIGLVLISFLIFACKSQDEILIVEPIIEDQPTQTIKYLALGDSYTIGQGVEESLRWPNQLAQMLLEENYDITKTEIIAKTGWKTSDLLSAIADNNVEDYNLVSLLIGVNNQYNNQSFSIFEDEFDLLLSKSIDIAGNLGSVFLLSIPDYGVTPFGNNNSQNIALDIDKYNEFMKQRCIDQGIQFIDITEISRQLGDLPGSLAPDNLHPSGSQYTKWTEKAFPIVKEILEE